MFAANVIVQGFLNAHGIKALSPTDTVVGNLSTAWGAGVTVYGNRVAAYGDDHYIVGDYVFSHGRNNQTAHANYSFATGEGLVATSNHTALFGRYNSLVDTAGLLVAVGNGTGPNHRSDAFRVYANGAFEPAMLVASDIRFSNSSSTIYASDGRIHLDAHVAVGQTVTAPTAQLHHAHITGTVVSNDLVCSNLVCTGQATLPTTHLDLDSVTVASHVSAPAYNFTHGTLQYQEGNIVASGADLRVLGNLVVTGNTMVLQTEVQTTDQIQVHNLGTGTALVVNQSMASYPILELLDNDQPVLQVQGHTVSALGNVVATNLLIPNGGQLTVATQAVTANVVPSQDNAHALGTPDARYQRLYVSQIQSTSDAREKTDIEDSDLGLEFVKALCPVKFRWKSTGTQHYGLLAQQVESVLGNGKGLVECANDRYSLSYMELVGPLVKALQELSDQLASLKLQVHALATSG